MVAAMMVGAIGAVRNSANTLTAASDAVDIAGYRRYVEKVTAEEDAKMDRILQSQSVREMGSGMNTHKATRPTFFMHGIMDNDGAGNTLKGCFAGDQFWYNLPIYNDKASLTNINKQVAKMKELIKEKVKKDPSTFANGYNLICHSQGGVVCRTLITTWNDHNVKTFVSLAGPVQGVQGYGTYLDFMPKWASDILSNNVVNTLAAQKKISCANYFHDRSSAAAQKDFRRWSEVLARINNEVPAKYCHRESLRKGCQPSSLGCKWRFSEGACTYEGDESGFNKTKQYQKNFMKLDHAVFMGSSADEAIKPWESTQFGYYKLGCGANSACKDTEKWHDSYLAKQNLVPLKAMEAAGKLIIRNASNIKHTNWVYGKYPCYTSRTGPWGHLL